VKVKALTPTIERGAPAALSGSAALCLRGANPLRLRAQSEAPHLRLRGSVAKPGQSRQGAARVRASGRAAFALRASRHCI